MKNTYSEMKDSGVEWIGKIPSNWKTVPAKFFIKLQAGYPFDSDKFDNFQGIPLIRIRDITSGYAGTFYKGDYSNEYIVQNNDLLVGMDGDFNVRWWQGGEAVLNQRCCRIFGQDGLLLRYFYYLLPFYLKIINELAYSTTVKHLSNSDILKGRICLPSFSEQTAIAAYLDEKCGTIDEIIAEAKASIEEYKAWKSSVIFEAVTKGLDPHAEMKDSGVEWIGKVPRHWRISRIKNECTNMDYLRDPISAENRVNVQGTYDYYGASGVIDKIDDFNVDDTVLLIGEDGANLVYRNLPLVYRASGKFWVNNHAHILKVSVNNDYDFVAYMLEAGDYTNYITGSAQPKLSQFNLMRFPIPMPPLREQHTIASHLNKKCAAIDGIIAEKEALIADMEAYKKSLIFETVTGKRKVC